MCNSYSIDELQNSLASVALRPGSTVMMHSSLFHLGRLNAHKYDEYAPSIVGAIQNHIGKDGTLAAPAAFYDYGSKSTPFDTRLSPVSRLLGVLSSYIKDLPGSVRSLNPIFSVSANGPKARHICGSKTGAAFGPDSPWQRMLDCNAEILLLGCELSDNTFTRYVEQRFGVPYLYNKMFNTPVYSEGEIINTSIVAPLRYHHAAVEYDPKKFDALRDRMRKAGLLREASLGGGTIKAISMHDCFNEIAKALSEDIHFFLKRPLPYDPREIPLV